MEGKLQPERQKVYNCGMHTASAYRYGALVLALSGALFSGYLSAVKFFSQTCALTVPCPLFLGYPACYYGFGMFMLLAILSFLWAAGKPLRTFVIGLSAFGSLFAAYFTAKEFGPLMQLFAHFSLLAIPSCVVGLAVYLAVLFMALRAPSER